MRKLIFITLITAGLASHAQDPNFSQFFASPLTLNPALTGKFNGSFRIAGNYRNQWPTFNNAFVTYTTSVDARILRNSIPENDQFGIGIMALKDESGGGVLKHHYLALSTAYHKALDENGYHQLGLGFQGTYVNKRLDVTGLKFEDMLQSNGFTGVTSESFSSDQINLTYFDMQLGVLYNGSTDGFNNFYVGASMYHVNRPKESFREGNYLIHPRLTFQGGGMIPVGEFNGVHFSALHSRQANATNTVAGAAFMLNLNQDVEVPTSLYIGTWYRYNDAVIPYVGLDFNNFQFGVSYDVNVSSLRPGSNMRGGIELSLIYIKKPVDQRGIPCPRF